MSKLVTIYGGSGFLGRYIASRMARAGWRVRVAVRRPNEALFVRTYGVVGQVEPVLCNVRDDASVAAVMQGADAVVYCVGTFDKFGKNNFDAVQHEGAERVARVAAGLGVGTLVHISAIGADSASDVLYARTKGLGEAGVLAHFPKAVILRPSVIFGPEDDFFNRFAGMAVMSPVLPVPGAARKRQASAPSSARRQYTYPSRQPNRRQSSCSVGEALIRPPAVKSHNRFPLFESRQTMR